MAKYKIDFVGVITSEPRYSWYDDREIPTVNAISIKQKMADLGIVAGDTVELQMHCFGGDVQEGHFIMSLFEDSGVILDVNILGCAYSEATYFVAKSNKARMSSNGHFMIHNVRGGNYGTAEELKSTVKDIEDYDNLLCDVLAAKSGKTPEFIKENYLDGKSDKGFTPQQAFEAGFVDEVYNGATITFQNSSYSKFVNSYFDIADENSRNNYYTKIRQNIQENKMSKQNQVIPPVETTEGKEIVTPGMLAVLAEKENALKEQIFDLENKVATIQNEKETASKKFADLLQDKDTEISTHLQAIGTLTQDKAKLVNEVKEGKIINKVFAAVAAMRKSNGLPLTETEVDKFKDGFLTMYKVDELNNNFVVTSKITNEVQKTSLWDSVQAFCKDQNSKAFHVQNGNGTTSSESKATTTSYSTKSREALFAEAKQAALTNFNAGTDGYYRFLINQGFKEELPMTVVQRLS